MTFSTDEPLEAMQQSNASDAASLWRIAAKKVNTWVLRNNFMQDDL